eukprot:1049190-Pyramimonas_sp.AAC.1
MHGNGGGGAEGSGGEIIGVSASFTAPSCRPSATERPLESCWALPNQARSERPPESATPGAPFLLRMGPRPSVPGPGTARTPAWRSA